SHAFGGASAARQAEQSGGKLPSAYSRKRASHARLQVTRTRPAIPLYLWGDRVLLPSRPSSTSGQELPRDHAPTLHTHRAHAHWQTARAVALRRRQRRRRAAATRV